LKRRTKDRFFYKGLIFIRHYLNVIIERMNKEVQGVKKYLKKIFLRWALITFFGLLLSIFVTYHLAYFKKIYPGISVAYQNLGNKTINQGLISLKNHINQNTTSYLKISSKDNQEWEIDLKELNFFYDTNLSVEKAYQIGRSKKPFSDLKAKAKSYFQGTNLGLEYFLDQDLLETKIATIAGQVFIPAIEPTIKVLEATPSGKTSRISIEQGKDGQQLNKRGLISIINQQITQINFQPINLPLIYTSPILTEEQIKNTQKRAEKFLNKKLILKEKENLWELEEKELIKLLSFTNGFNQDEIKNWAGELALVINRKPQNAAFRFSEGKVAEFKPAKEGKTLEEDKTVDLIVKSLEELEKGQTRDTINLPINISQPIIKTADVNSLGIKKLVGKGVSYFKGSISSRIHNINLASSKLNGLLIPPGEVFSFNQALGDVSRSTGYQEAYIIKDGRTILGDGGGVCQVSTTLFRATLDAGLPIIERKAHAYRVSYYEQNSSVGLDATVFNPTADLKIKNDTPAYLLIQTHFDKNNYCLIFELYGTSDGRSVSISKSRMWDQSPPPPDLYQDDPTLPAGQIKQIDWKSWGAKVSFDYKVERFGRILQNRIFYSNYKPWQAIYLKGTGPIQ